MKNPLWFRAAAVLAALPVVLFSFSGCGKQDASKATASASSADAAPPERAINFKIGIMTGTVSQGEDEFRAAQMIIKKYGADHVKHVTYPDNFMNEQETVIAQLVGLAADPDVKVIVVGQAIPGSIAAARKIREQRPDILIGFIEPHEDPGDGERGGRHRDPARPARPRTDDHRRSRRTMGVDRPRPLLVPAPHVAGAAGAPARHHEGGRAPSRASSSTSSPRPIRWARAGCPPTQQFVLEDVPRELKNYGPKTAFFSTNCGMKDPLIKSVLTNGGYIPEQCCPSPTHGYPDRARHRDPARQGRRHGLHQRREQARDRRAPHDAATSRTWPVPEMMLVDPRDDRPAGRLGRRQGRLQGSGAGEGVHGAARRASRSR